MFSINMECSSSTRFMDLPNEILIFILTKLNIIDVFKFININKRLDNILCDHEVTNDLKLFTWSSNSVIYPLDNEILNFFCLKILPKIGNHVKSLNLEALSMENILRATHYPHLNKIRLYNIDVNTCTYLFNSKKFNVQLFF